MNESRPLLNEKQCSVRGLQAITQQASILGINHECVFAHTRIKLSDLNNEDLVISQDDEDQISRNLIQAAADPLLALKLGSGLRAESFGMPGFAALSAETRQDAIDTLAEFTHLIGSHFNVSSVLSSDKAIIDITPCHNISTDLISYYSDLQMAALVFGEGERQDIIDNLIEVRLMHQQSHLKFAYENFFGCPVSFSHHCNSVSFKSEFLATPMPRSDSATARLCREECRKKMQQFQAKNSYTEKVTEALLQYSNSFPTITAVAKKLNLPERSLRRYLANEGTSYKELLSSVRFELAQKYLKKGISVDSVATLVGYSEAANFSHAFKRWAGMSPNQFKKSNPEHY